jgi:hypothetical protein
VLVNAMAAAGPYVLPSRVFQHANEVTILHSWRTSGKTLFSKTTCRHRSPPKFRAF